MGDEDDLPILPYGNDDEPNSGHSGSDTSAERAKRRDSSGATAKIQGKIMGKISASDFDGVTVSELRDALPDTHHGTISGSLSNLHAGGRIARLTEKRGGCKIYVLPRYTGSRETERQGK